MKNIIHAINRVEAMRKNPPRRIKRLSQKTRIAIQKIIQADRELDKQENHERKAS
ncbi:MAG TPA: hypothetical protein P5295_18010 [Spirochaetota bacterium]|nr:hypothetical protein [Spirochaetota bacterium]